VFVATFRCNTEFAVVILLSSMIRFLAVICLIWSVGCARAPLKGPDNAFRYQKRPPALVDDLDLEPLIQGVRDQIAFLEQQKGPTPVRRSSYRFGKREL